MPPHPEWPDRDRFVLSAGHGSMLLYALLHLAGYGLTIEELEAFRQWGSRTPGHPEHGLTPGVETTTGPLGAGFSNGVGMAIAEAFLAATFNRPGFDLVDHHTYAIVGDGDLMEGVASEAASLAGHLGLGKLIYLYDDNQISIEGCTDLAFTEDVGARFEAYGWQVRQGGRRQRPGGHRRGHLARPAPRRASRPWSWCAPSSAAAAPTRPAPPRRTARRWARTRCRLTKEALGWPGDLFFAVPDRVREQYAAVAAGGSGAARPLGRDVRPLRAGVPGPGPAVEGRHGGQAARGLGRDSCRSSPPGESVATRSASGKVLNALAPLLPTLIGGSADLAPSNNTYLAGLGDFEPGSPGGRNLHFGVREHAMGGVLNGLAAHGGVFPYGGTFLIFSDYMRPAIRLAALSHFPVIYVFTHDSIGLGEDGPTHQPIEHLASLRAMPGLVVIRPSDANETVMAWRAALERRDGPTALVLTRQNLPVFDRERARRRRRGCCAGGYVLKDAPSGRPDVILMATGSEVEIALEAADTLAGDGVAARVVALPSWELFERQDAAYREAVLPRGVTARVSIEAASTFGWDRYVGAAGASIGIDHFGASAPAKVLYEEFGITAENMVATALRLLGKDGAS